VLVELNVGGPGEQLEVELSRAAFEPQAREPVPELGRRQLECTPAATDLGEAALGGIERVRPLNRKRVELLSLHG
jgi:hypothetical protein